MNEMESFVNEFIAESHENLDQVDRDLVELEQHPTSPDRLSSIFRAIHTIKGTSGFFRFATMTALAHAGENVLSRLRSGELILTSPITSALLAMGDALREILKMIERTGQEGAHKYEELIGTLTAIYSDKPGSGERQVDTKNLAISVTEPQVPKRPAPQPPVVAEPPLIGEVLVEAKMVAKGDLNAALEQKQSGDSRQLGEILVAQDALRPADLLAALEVQKRARAFASSANIRVDVDQLDKLMNLVGELVLARNQILRLSSRQQDAGLQTATQRLNVITTELQEGVMKTRMQPIEKVWNKFPRMVRDLAEQFGKKVRLSMEGQETELDRTLIEAVRDPLTHAIRNCIDHGIETPEDRVAAGKQQEGHLLVRAFHEGGLVNIEISDDGLGIDTDMVKRKAVELGFISAEEARNLDERAACALIFVPGLSTSDKVTGISGRGVGMDVVKTNIEKVGGMVEVSSKPRQGTTLRIRIPLTLTIIPALTVMCGDERYAIPQASLLELLRLDREKSHPGIEMIHGSPVYRLRGKLLPLVYLRQEIGLDPPPADAGSGDGLVTNIVVLQAGNEQFGLVVDEVHDTGEIVVKPLGKEFKGISAFVGATITGDGEVVLILDVLGMAQRARVIADAAGGMPVEAQPVARPAPSDEERVLLFTVSGGLLMAMPLSLVTRLEEFSRSSIERTGTDEVVQYRGEILPVIDLCRLLPTEDRATRPEHPEGNFDVKVQVIVYSGGSRKAGFAVERVVDIVEDQLTVQYPPSRKGSLGSAVIQGKVAEILDVNAVMASLGSTRMEAS